MNLGVRIIRLFQRKWDNQSLLDDDNREKILCEFLTTLLKTYPDVEFLSSDKLIELFS